MTAYSEPLLCPEDVFSFGCHAGLSCFTSCCRDVNILLSPYDVIRLKRGLDFSSTELLERHTKTLIAPKAALPAVQLKMDEERDLRCPFVGPAGCSVYGDRPWSCRMYPLDPDGDGDRYRIIANPSRCHGLEAREKIKLADWFRDQGLEPYAFENGRFADITADNEIAAWRMGHPQGARIFHLACYDLDRFRDLVFGERLYEMVRANDINLDALCSDDLALLAFSYAWLKALAQAR
jgi:Fe-S-cluster containining protein